MCFEPARLTFFPEFFQMKAHSKQKQHCPNVCIVVRRLYEADLPVFFQIEATQGKGKAAVVSGYGEACFWKKLMNIRILFSFLRILFCAARIVLPDSAKNWAEMS